MSSLVLPFKEETLQLDERKNPISNLKNHHLRDIKNE